MDAVAYRTQVQAAHEAVDVGGRLDARPTSGRRASWPNEIPSTSPRSPLVGSEARPILGLLDACATVERLLWRFGWALDDRWGKSVLECDPTTSSVAGPSDLRTEGAKGEAWFEVSDVLTAHDSNDKLPDRFVSSGTSPRRCRDVPRVLSFLGAANHSKRVLILESPTGGHDRGAGGRRFGLAHESLASVTRVTPYSRLAHALSNSKS